ncbi:hypothetical protein [Methylophilus sp. DW102]|uniref:hypothetical protein n=1 Tax=Methylophilus sp. DW102 TaxID=3095607 RepID=UPI0030893421|nr:hypothetical protein MTDW_04240 [Methylophilus sp. DW102]
MSWIIQNKDWLFSGVAITIPIAIAGWFFSTKSKSYKQSQKGGNNSINIQVGGNFKAGNDKNHD